MVSRRLSGVMRTERRRILVALLQLSDLHRAQGSRSQAHAAPAAHVTGMGRVAEGGGVGGRVEVKKKKINK